METVAQKKVFGLPYNWGIGLLCVLGSVVLYEFYDNVLAGPSVPVTSRSTATVSPSAVPLPGSLPGADNTPRRTNAMTNRGRSEEFNPPIHSKRPEDRLDIVKRSMPNTGLCGRPIDLFESDAKRFRHTNASTDATHMKPLVRPAIHALP